jgi:two-component system response regulator CpxR
LLIDDDPGLCSLMAEFFSSHDFRLDAAHNGGSGLARALEGNYDLVLLDVMLPGLDGFEILRQLRDKSSVPVIMLTARTAQQDRVKGLNAGADDYLPKPFEPRELLARVRAVLRRTSQPLKPNAPILEINSLRLDSRTREVWQNQKRVDVTSFEFDVLEVLMRSAGRIVSRDELAGVLYHRESTPFERAIDVHVSHLRKKLEMQDRPLIRTVRGVGYLLVLSAQEEK